MDLIEFEEKRHVSREEAAAVLRTLADHLARHNDLEFTREGLRYTVDVPDSVEIEVEIEIGDKESELEVKISW
jgi:amphi-Trp domain-containing protein